MMNDFGLLIARPENGGSLNIEPLQGSFISDIPYYPIGFTLWLLELNHFVVLPTPKVLNINSPDISG
jgi:hypothetical protein